MAGRQLKMGVLNLVAVAQTAIGVVAITNASAQEQAGDFLGGQMRD
jgi:hypothetical protein